MKPHPLLIANANAKINTKVTNTAMPRPTAGLRRRLVMAGLLGPWLARAGNSTPKNPPAALANMATPVHLPADAGTHLDHRIEWWYLTGWASDASGAPRFGYQLTFFRRRLDATQDLRSPLAARHLLFADVAITDVRQQRLQHLQRMARWSGQPPGQNAADQASAAIGQTAVQIGDWSLVADGSVDGNRASLRARAFDPSVTLDLRCTPQQAPLLQGLQGVSRKGPEAAQFSHYYSLPQLQVEGRLALNNESFTLGPGSKAWLDHEWSDTLLHADATGWDWIGINLRDGGALTAFRLRDANGQPIWAGGSFRKGGKLEVFAPSAVHFEALREWHSPLSAARYPLAWRVQTPAGSFQIEALVENQEIDSRATTGAIYWEGLVRAHGAGAGAGAEGYGYLEMTGYAAALQT